MKQERRLRAALIIICLLLAVLLLSSCGNVFGTQKETDQLLVRIMTCIEEDDAEGLAAISEDPDAVRQVFPDIQAYWPARSDDTYTCKEFTARIGVQSGEKYKIVTAVYSVQSSDGEYQVTLEARLERDEPLIHIFHVVSAEDLAGTE